MLQSNSACYFSVQYLLFQFSVLDVAGCFISITTTISLISHRRKLHLISASFFKRLSPWPNYSVQFAHFRFPPLQHTNRAKRGENLEVISFTEENCGKSFDIHILSGLLFFLSRLLLLEKNEPIPFSPYSHSASFPAPTRISCLGHGHAREPPN
ncbi:hypothetical protein B0T10DRAFT_59547 [Thelonectria olida]|uniref:Uncharacterized protein n=1 Tax=Thelonectria olida TaxID=1576542 RepID=A0A9P9APW7_9HYPO|nr:hypothetical protein B0T10DRAFT_59547 [Thelonectria olida]